MSDSPVDLTPAQRAEMMRIWGALLHRFATAAGGQIAIRLSDIAEDVGFSFTVGRDGIARFVAHPPKPKTANGLVAVGADALANLPDLSRINGHKA